MGAECPHLEDGVVGGIRGGGEEGGGDSGLVTDERVDGGVKEVKKGWEVTLDGNDWGELGTIQGKELKEGVKGLVLEVDGADLEAGKEVTDEEDEVGIGKRDAKEVEDDGIDVGEVVEKARAEEEVEVMKVEGEERGSNVEVTLEEELVDGERGVEVTGGKGMEGTESG